MIDDNDLETMGQNESFAHSVAEREAESAMVVDSDEDVNDADIDPDDGSAYEDPTYEEDDDGFYSD